MSPLGRESPDNTADERQWPPEAHPAAPAWAQLNKCWRCHLQFVWILLFFPVWFPILLGWQFLNFHLEIFYRGVGLSVDGEEVQAVTASNEPGSQMGGLRSASDTTRGSSSKVLCNKAGPGSSQEAKPAGLDQKQAAIVGQISEVSAWKPREGRGRLFPLFFFSRGDHGSQCNSSGEKYFALSQTSTGMFMLTHSLQSSKAGFPSPL